MKIYQFQNYAFDPDELEAALAKHDLQSRTPVLVEIFDGDAKRFGWVRAGGSLFQPTYLGVRDDIPVEDCTVDQLKIKPE